MAFFGFSNAAGWLAFLSLIPFLLIVLRRTRPQTVAVPTLMFFEKYLRRSSDRSFLQRVPWTMTFLLQLLSFLLLSLFFVQPYLVFGQEGSKDSVVLVVDTSASMMVDTVFDDARELAMDHLGQRNTILLAGGVPRIGLEDASKGEARRFLRALEAGATDSPLGDAMVFAEQHLEGEHPVVVVVSDFLPTSGTQLSLAKSSLENKGASVLFLPVSSDVENNVGIVDVIFNEKQVQVSVKNYGSPKDVLVQTPDGEVLLALNRGESRIASFSAHPGESLVRLVESDNFPVDDVAHIVIPDDERVRISVITEQQSPYLDAALRALEYAQIEYFSPLQVISHDSDVYLLDQIGRGGMTSENVRVIEDAVRTGAGVIVVAHKNSRDVDYGELLPLSLGDVGGVTAVVIDHENRITGKKEFGSLSWHLSTSDEEGLTLAHGDQGSVLQVDALGNGVRMFTGMSEDASNFYFNPYFPVFWSTMIRYAARVDGPEERTIRGGSFLSLPGPTPVTTPSGFIKIASVVVFDEIGIWNVGDRQYGVSLLNEIESGFAAQDDLATTIDILDEEDVVKKDITEWILVAGALVLLSESFVARRRGEF